MTFGKFCLYFFLCSGGVAVVVGLAIAFFYALAKGMSR
jgi:hypothetical protein